MESEESNFHGRDDQKVRGATPNHAEKFLPKGNVRKIDDLRCSMLRYTVQQRFVSVALLNITVVIFDSVRDYRAGLHWRDPR